jgi:tRNA(fMet)-specific endonuclease VapC
MRYLLDTNTCIAAMRHDALVLQRMAVVAPTECAISTITTYELYTGIEKCAAPAKELARSICYWLRLVNSASTNRPREAARIRALLESQGCMIGAYDVLLAGHARSARLTLVSANTGEFSRVPALSLENW